MSTVEYTIDAGEESASEEPGGVMFDSLRPLPRISIHAFCESERLQRVMQRCQEDRRMSKVSVRITSGGIQAACNMFSGSPTPNLIILETRAGAKAILEELAPLASVCDPSTKVILVGEQNDIALYRELMRHGISEYMVHPVSVGDILMAVTGIFVDPDAEPLGRSIVFIGAKGGVGASTLAHNCAFNISQLFQTETILADLDLPYGTANIDFDQDPMQGIAEAVAAPDRLDEVFLDRLLTKCSEHLSLLAAPSTLERAFDFDGPAFLPVLDVLQRSAPVTVLDMPHVWTDWARQVLTQADEVVLCAAPDLANLRNTKNMVDALRKMRPNDKPPHFVLNQVGMPKRPEIAPDDFIEPLELEPLAILSFDAQLFGAAANSGRMISEIDARCPAAETMSQIAHAVTGRTIAKKRRSSGLLGLLKRK